MAGGNRSGDGGEWTREPPDRTATTERRRGPSRLRRRAPAIQGSADRRIERPPVGHEVRHRRMRVAPRKARPFVPGRKVVLDSRARTGRAEATHDDDNRSAQPDRGEAPRRPTPTRCSCAPRARPTSRRRSGRSSGSTTARRRPTSSSRSRAASGWAATRSWASGPRRLLEVRDGVARTQTRPVTRRRLHRRTCRSTTPRRRDPLDAIRRVRPAPPRPADRGHAALHRRRRRRARLRRGRRSFEPTVPLPERDPVGAPTAAFIETDLVLVFDHLTHTLSRDRLAPHRDARPRGPLPDRRGGDLRGARADGPAERRRDRRGTGRRRGAAGERLGRGRARTGSRRASGATPTSTPSRSPRRRSRPARRSRSSSPGASRSTCRPIRRPGEPLDGIALYRALRRVNPSPYLFFVRTPSFEVVGASPELLLQVEGDKLTTHPIAGTRPRGADEREDQHPRRAAPARPEGAGRAHHARRPRAGTTSAGSSRPGTVTVSKYMEVERYSHVLHLVSHVEGRLQAGARRARRAAGGLPGRAPCRAPRRSGRCS